MEHPIFARSAGETTFQTLMRKLKSHRVIWCYLYLALYLWVVVYAMLKYPTAVNTIIVTTGGMVSFIFSAYIIGTSYENVNYGKDMTKMTVASTEVNKDTDER